MSIESQIRAFAGVFVVVSVLLAHFVSPWWLLFTLFVGLNLFQSAFTRFCPLEKILRKVEGKPAGPLQNG